MVFSVAQRDAGKHGGHDLRLPASLDRSMDEPCFDDQVNDSSKSGGELDAPRSFVHTTPLGVIGSAEPRMRLASPIAPSLYPGPENKGCWQGSLFR